MRIVTNSGQLRWLKNYHLVERVDTRELISTWYDGGVYGLMILDLERAGGLSAMRAVHSAGSTIPVIGLSKQWQSDAWLDLRAQFIEHGGDYLLRSPIHRRELTACVGALKRRFQRVCSVIRLYDARIVLNTSTFEISVDGQPLPLTPKQTWVLMDLALHYRQLRTPNQTLFAAFETAFEVENASTLVSTYVKRIRRQLNDRIPGSGKLVHTSYGQGYFLSDIPVQ